MVIARIRIFATVPVTPLIVTVSPTRIGRSNNKMIPETKFAKISCIPKPRPTERAANNHCNFDQDIPSVENAHAPPTATKM